MAERSLLGVLSLIELNTNSEVGHQAFFLQEFSKSSREDYAEADNLFK